ncbi:MAG: hypothetical protein EP326_04440 [Deltaproteobacteria bacterium]|nr:MAG: hypothetical protein EP326_04440 [Deltaproteobacteria bacterium]TNF25899.1 MAG: hypothetical protein EP319_15130 [Deltaproteobacteria bacterium]
MSNKDKVDIANSHVIRKILKDISTQKYPVRVWQDIESTNKFTDGFIVGYKGNESKMIIKAKKGEKFFFDREKDTYFHSTYKDLIFKTRILNGDLYEMILAKPIVVKIDDLRVDVRKNFGLNTYQTVTLIMKEGQELKVNVMDVSENGMCILLAKRYFSLFSEHDVFVISKSTLPQIVGKQACVKNLGQVDKVLTTENVYRIGFEFIDATG